MPGLRRKSKMSIISGKKVMVMPLFDSGEFKSVFSICPKEGGFNSNLQHEFNLSFNEFDDLSVVICAAVELYFEEREKGVKEKIEGVLGERKERG